MNSNGVTADRCGYPGTGGTVRGCAGTTALHGSDVSGYKAAYFTQMEKLDLASVLEGEDLQSDTDIMVTYRYAKANGIAVGDEITILGQKFHVSGLCNKSDYAIMLYDLTESMPDRDGFGIGIITKQAMESWWIRSHTMQCVMRIRQRNRISARQFTIRIKQRNTSKKK